MITNYTVVSTDLAPDQPNTHKVHTDPLQVGNIAKGMLLLDNMNFS